MHKTFNAKCNLAKVCVHVCVCVWVQVHDLSVCIIKNVWWKKCSIFYLFTYIMLLYTVCSMHIALAHKLFFCHVLFYFFFACVYYLLFFWLFFLCVIQHFFFIIYPCIFLSYAFSVHFYVLVACGILFRITGIGQKLCFHMVWNRLLLLSG